MIKREHLWPIGVVVALAVNVAANVVIIRAANQPQSEVVESDYYRKAVAWDSTLAERDRSAALGWHVDASIARLAPGRARVAVTLADSSGAPVTGADVSVTAIHNLAAGLPVTAHLAADASGYAAELPLVHSGLWELRLAVKHGADRYQTSMRRECPGTP